MTYSNFCVRFAFSRCGGGGSKLRNAGWVKGSGKEGLGAPPGDPGILDLMIPLRRLGYTKTNPIYAKAENDFAGLFIDDPEDFRIQPCLSPIWDTAINIISLAESGVAPAEPN